MSLQLKQMPYLLKRGAKIEKKEIVTMLCGFNEKFNCRKKGTKIAHIYCIFIVVFFYLFSKRRRAFFKLTSFRAWL